MMSIETFLFGVVVGGCMGLFAATLMFRKEIRYYQIMDGGK